MANTTLINDDCLVAFNDIPDESVDVIFADPPYNLQLGKCLTRPNGSKYAGVVKEWDKFSGFYEDDLFTHQWLTKARRVLKPEGTLWVMGSYHNIHRIGNILQDLEYWLLNDVVWIKSNPTPNFRGVRLTNAQENILWAQKSRDAKYTFNYQLLKALNGGKQLRSDWYLPICAGKERLRDSSGKSIHSTQKPIDIVLRALLVSTRPNDTVLDPFSGTGTTGVAAKLLNRNFIGFERDAVYCKYASNRINNVETIIESDDEILEYLNGDHSNDRIARIVSAFRKKQG